MLRLLRFPVLILAIPFGVLVSLNAALRGWGNGRFWWEEWRNVWFDRPPCAISFES